MARKRRFTLEDLPPDLAARIVVNPWTGCWEWQHDDGPDPYRYGFAEWDGRKSNSAHRLAYKILVGPIPDGFAIDHVYIRGCRAKSCCYPAHLEAVPQGVNTARGNRATIAKGIMPFVLERIAKGTANTEEREFARVAWMLPLDFHPGHAPPPKKVTPEYVPVPSRPSAPVRYVPVARPAVVRKPRVIVFTLEETAYQTGMTKAFLRRARAGGEGPASFVAEDGSVRYRLADIEAWVNSPRYVDEYSRWGNAAAAKRTMLELAAQAAASEAIA